MFQKPEVTLKTGSKMIKGGCLCPMTPKVFGFQDKFLASGHIITKQLKESSDSYFMTHQPCDQIIPASCDMNRGK